MPTKLFPDAINPELAGIEVEAVSGSLGLGDKANAADLATEIIARANADIALATAKMNKPGGTAAQYIRGDETLATFPTIPNAQIQADYTQANSAAIDFIKNKPAAISVTSGVARTIQTVAAAANGIQLSSARNALVSYSVSIQVTATIGGAASGAVVLEICPTNSATAGDWVTVNRAANSQSMALAVAIQSVHGATNTLCGIVPAGYYSRLRSIIVSGVPVFGYVSGQEVLL